MDTEISEEQVALIFDAKTKEKLNPPIPANSNISRYTTNYGQISKPCDQYQIL
ncbi:MAG: hypothetical protein ACMG6E_01285 [Candidatus Roizmanbacteria bacterium]